jgi:hypothetical protein
LVAPSRNIFRSERERAEDKVQTVVVADVTVTAATPSPKVLLQISLQNVSERVGTVLSAFKTF